MTNSAQARAAADHGRNATLDLFRGVAAIVVMLVHVAPGYGVTEPQSGYLAVDLFFLMSGFVIAKSYDHRLQTKWSARDFLMHRLIRLYPLFFLGVVLGTLKVALQYRFGAHPVPLWDALQDTGTALLMLPSPTHMFRPFDPTFPINLPAWSLFFEMTANLAYALLFRHLTRGTLAAIIGTSAAALCIGIVSKGSDNIGGWHTWGFGFPRAAFPFFLGVLICRLRFRAPKFGTKMAVILALALLAILMTDPGQKRFAFDMLSVFVLFPALVSIAISTTIRGQLASVAASVGAISYAVYILHAPVDTLFWVIAERLWPSALSLTGMIGFVAAMLTLSWLADRYYDPWARGFLRSLTLKSLPASTVAHNIAGTNHTSPQSRSRSTGD